MGESVLGIIAQVLDYPYFLPISVSLVLVLSCIRILFICYSQKPRLVIENIRYKYLRAHQREKETHIHIIISYDITNKSTQDNTVLNAYYRLGMALHKQEYIIFPGGFTITGKTSEHIDAGVIVFNMGNAPLKKNYPLVISVTDQDKKIHSASTTVIAQEKSL